MKYKPVLRITISRRFPGIREKYKVQIKREEITKMGYYITQELSIFYDHRKLTEVKQT